MTYRAPERGSSLFSGPRQVGESLGTLNFSSGRGGRHEFAIPQACAVVGTIRCRRTSREVGLSRFACAVRTSVGSVTPMSHMIEPSPALSTVPPDFLTLDEAAAVLRVGRTTAYREANAFEASVGTTGIPVVRYGKQFRVPRCRLEEQLGGAITWPLCVDPPDTTAAVRPSSERQPARVTVAHSGDQLSLAIES